MATTPAVNNFIIDQLNPDDSLLQDSLQGPSQEQKRAILAEQKATRAHQRKE